MPERRDKRGRRIGYNWWREYNVSLYWTEHAVWSERRESDQPAYEAAGAAHSGAAMYQLSDEEYRSIYPAPTFKALLIANRGMHQGQAA